MNIIYKQLGENDIEDLRAMLALYVDVFEMQNVSMPGSADLETLLLDNKVVFYAAIAGGNILAGLTAYILPSLYSASCQVYIYDLAVRTRYQRKGIGRNLIASFKNYCKEQGYKELFVQAACIDKHAIGFYNATGGTAEKVFHFSYALG